jgi:hypothetical protein
VPPGMRPCLNLILMCVNAEFEVIGYELSVLGRSNHGWTRMDTDHDEPDGSNLGAERVSVSDLGASENLTRRTQRAPRKSPWFQPSRLCGLCVRNQTGNNHRWTQMDTDEGEQAKSESGAERVSVSGLEASRATFGASGRKPAGFRYEAFRSGTRKRFALEMTAARP